MDLNDNLAPQMYQKAEELKIFVGKKKNLFYDAEAWTAHQELQTLLQKLLLTDLDYALDKKVEADLWNVCFKDYISHLQSMSRDKSSLRKKQASEAQVMLTWFLDMASGFYLMFLQEIRSSFDLDFPFLRDGPIFGMFSRKEEGSKKLKPHMNNCIYICQHCLVHLGDIARYRNQARQAESFYRQAIQIAPGSGQAYNQIALLEANRGDKLSATFFYVRSLALKYPFPAAASNLAKLFSRIEQDQKSLPAKDAKISGQTFVPYVLRFHALIHHAQHLRTAAKICHQLNESLTTLVAAESLTTWQLVQVVTISLFLMHEAVDNPNKKESICQDEQEIARLVCELLAGMLNAFLLPVYTLKQGESLLDYFALPAAKLILEWIALNPLVLEEKGFLKRMQIWPSLCRMLNELSNLTHEKSEQLAKWEEFPLPEDYDLQAYLPLLPRLKRYNFKQMLRSSSEDITEEHQRLLRAKRMTELGQFLASDEFKGRKMISARDFVDINFSAQITFEAIEHRVPEELIKELDILHIESSSEEEEEGDDDEDEEELKFEDPTPSQGKMSGILKSEPSTVSPPSASSPSDPFISSILVAPPKKRTNVAMAAIMRQANINDGSSKQVTFKSPSPASPSNSQDSSTMSQDSAVGGGGPLYDNLLQRLSVSSSLGPGLPARPPPDFSVPPPPVLHPHRPSLGLIAPAGVRRAASMPWTDPRHSASVVSRTSSNNPDMRHHHQPPPSPHFFSAQANKPPDLPHFGPLGLERGSGYPNLNQSDYNHQLLNLFNPSANVTQANANLGPSYSLFSGPSWSGGRNSLLGNPVQDPNRDQNVFQQGGPSALESLLRQQRKE